jgi:CRISPR/Cas system-associated exonuclease Cas4 (RecB family)
MSVSVGRIAKILAGECPHRIWREIREPSRDEEDDERLQRWREQHDKLVALFVDEFEANNPGWVVVTEHDVEVDDVAGRIDVLARGRGNQLRIFEVKTGKEYPYHRKQLSLYLAMEKMRNPEAEIIGALRYIDRPPLTMTPVDVEQLWKKAGNAKRLLEDESSPDRKGNVSCRWCRYRDTCPVYSTTR